MERNVEINISSTLSLFGKLNSLEEQSDALIIFVNGMLAFKDFHLYHNSSRFFPQEGFDTFRFNFVSRSSDSRDFSSCSMQDLICDVNTVINHFCQQYSKIFIVGHSMGGGIAFSSHLDHVTALCLWDPCLFPKGGSDYSDRFVYSEELNHYLFKCGYDVLVPKQIVSGFDLFSPDQLKYVTKPTHIICADHFKYKFLWKEHLNAISCSQKTLDIIPNSTHIFEEEGVDIELFHRTLTFISQF